MNDSDPVTSPPAQAETLRIAEFDPKVCQYWLVSAYLVCIFTVVGIVAIPFVLIFGGMLTRKYLASHSLELGRRELRLRKGLLTKVEKTIPLEKITDVGFIQGPLMRLMNLEGITVETAGQTSMGPLMNLQGVINAREFRDEVLAQRDRVSDDDRPQAIAGTPTPVPQETEMVSVLRDMQQTLLRIEKNLAPPERNDG
ncbi:MAG: PH domain-containing protein [Planctomycetota bacterium]